MSDFLPTYVEVAAQIEALVLSVDPSELHGSLCALRCGAPQRTNWLAEAMSDEHLAPPLPGSPLARLDAATVAQLAAADFGLELLLPEDDAPVSERGEALVAWCRGFLGGVGLAGLHGALAEETREALVDLARIAESEVSYDDPEADEEALAELEEFVRVAALLVHGDCLAAHDRRRLH
ncbi:UPF0149 family protein [Silanimonas sp.]|uniref:UPF0149 family protein n=1 Tax=Silanimonas sp. TaxID=1929290 RepID=UPI0025CD2CE7|nr:UPF0149 family protein [Silanimonas sp.]